MRDGLGDRLRTGLAMMGAAICAARASSAPRIIYVDKSAPAGGDGTSWQNAFSDLQNAIRVQTTSNAEIEIRMAQGTYTPDQGTGDRTKFFAFHYNLGSAMTLSLQGSFAGLQGADPDARDYVATPTILSGDLKGDDGPDFANRTDNACLIAIIGAQQTLTIDGITVRGASTEQLTGYSGGGMMAFVQSYGAALGPATLRVYHCNFEENDPTGAPAGGLSVSAGTIEIWYSRFIGNRLRDGGGGGLAMRGSGYLYECTFDSNTARFGGALYSPDDAQLNACTFTRNQAEYQGGATFGSIGANTSLFVDNRAGSSGGAIAAYENLSLLSCTIADNAAPAGSAVSVLYGAAHMANVVIWGNTGPGPAIRLIDNVRESAIEHSVLEGGAAAVEISGLPVTLDGIRSGDPHFLRPRSAASGFENWNYRLGTGSAAKNIGGDNWITLDLDGAFYQSKYGPADAGCYFDTRYLCEGTSVPLDAIVDDSDFVDFIAAYDLTISPPASPNADFNRDGLVDDADFAIFVIGYDRLLCEPPW